MVERRTRRSHVPVEALTLFLESQRATLAPRGLTVTTKDGTLLAAAGPSLKAGVGKSDRVATWELRAGGVDVIVASRGGRLSHDLGSGVKRILTGSGN